MYYIYILSLCRCVQLYFGNSAIKDHVARGIVLRQTIGIVWYMVGGIVGRAHKFVGKYACAVDRAAYVRRTATLRANDGGMAGSGEISSLSESSK